MSLVNFDVHSSTANSLASEDAPEFSAKYELCEIISCGPFATVHRAVLRKTGEQFAVKVIDIDRFLACPGTKVQDVHYEAEICSSLRHPFIVEFYESFIGDKRAFLVFEYMDGMDLCFEIVKRAMAGFVYSEAVASHYVRQLMTALAHCHHNGVVHRDIRTQSALLANKENSAPVKLSGFAFALQLAKPTTSASLKEKIGNPHYMAPEMMEGEEYGTACDLWSFGVLLFVLLCGQMPFYGSKQQIQESIRHGRYCMKSRVWSEISDYAKDLLVKLLTVDPSQRITADKALNHPWLKERDRCASRKHLHETVEELRKFNTRRKAKSRVLGAVNSQNWSSNSTLMISSQVGGDSDASLNSGVYKVLFSLDQIAALTDIYANNDGLKATFIHTSLKDDNLQYLLELYDRISTQPKPVDPPSTDAGRWAKEISERLSDLPDLSAEAAELRSLLASVQLQAVLQAHDVVAHEVYGESPRGRSARGGTEGAASADGRAETPPAVLPAFVNGGANPDEMDLLDDDALVGQVTRVRLVQFQKNTDEPMGITLKVTEEGKCYVARIMHGGMIHRQGTLHVGDEIREINGVSVANRSVDTLQRMLRDARGSVTFKIVPSYRSAPPACEIFVRAQFDYDPAQDDLIPCPQAGVAFRTGDILQVISKDDHNWWQARHVAVFPALGTGHSAMGQQTPGASVAGLIPSPELQEWRTACLAIERSKDNSNCMRLTKKKRQYSSKYMQKHSAMFDQLDLVTYEEVIRLPTFRRKTLVLLGAHGVGRRHIKNTLIQRHHERFAYPIPHTTRPPRKDEQEGKHYYFVSHEKMIAEIHSNQFLEYGTHEDYMYGTKLETIREIHRRAKVAILDVEPQALKVLRTAEYSPFVVFIAAPNLQGLQDPDGSLERLLRESELLRQAYGHFFDYVILNNDIDETIRQLELILEKLHTCPQWVPVSWVY